MLQEVAKSVLFKFRLLACLQLKATWKQGLCTGFLISSQGPLFLRIFMKQQLGSSRLTCGGPYVALELTYKNAMDRNANIHINKRDLNQEFSKKRFHLKFQ